MRRLIPILTLLGLLGQVLGYASAPGTYPEEEMRAGNDMEMPTNPYQNGWTGYDFYYEKEPKSAPVPGGSGKMPAFQSIEEVSTDRESPEDPGSSVYQASGAEHGGVEHTTPPVTPPPVKSSPKVSTEKVMVSPSSSTKDTITITTTPISTPSTISTTKSLAPSSTVPPVQSKIDAPIPSKAPKKFPESGSDLSAADNLELLYGGGGTPEPEKKDERTTTHKDPPPPPSQSPQNLLTKLFEKKVLVPKSYDDLGGPSGYEMRDLGEPSGDAGGSTSSRPNEGPEESGYGAGSKSSKWSEPNEDRSHESGYEGGSKRSDQDRSHAPGAQPEVVTVSPVEPTAGYGQNIPAINPTSTVSAQKPSVPSQGGSSGAYSSASEPSPKATGATPSPMKSSGTPYQPLPNPSNYESAPSPPTSQAVFPSHKEVPSTPPRASFPNPRVAPKPFWGSPAPEQGSSTPLRQSSPDYKIVPPIIMTSSASDHYGPSSNHPSNSPGAYPRIPPGQDPKNEEIPYSVTEKTSLVPESSENYEMISTSNRPTNQGPPIPPSRGFYGHHHPHISEFQGDSYEPDYSPTKTGNNPPTGNPSPYPPNTGGSPYGNSNIPSPTDNYPPNTARNPYGDTNSATFPSVPVPQTDNYSPTGYSNPSSSGAPLNHGNAPGAEPSIPVPSAPTYQPDVLDYGARPNNHAGKLTPTKTAYPDDTWNYSNSNNAISPRDPYDHFGTSHQHQTHAPSQQSPHHYSNHGMNFEEDPNDEMDGGYGSNDLVIVPLRPPGTTTTTTNTEVRAQISEIDRIAESFENSAREPVEYEQKITSESSKGITVEAGKDIMKHFGRKARKCCDCCEKQPVSRNIETKIEPLHVQQAVDPSRQLGERQPVENYAPIQGNVGGGTVGGSAYVQQPVMPPPQQTAYQQPFQQYQPQYPQSYPYQQPACGCQPQPQNCCAPPAPCCLPKIPCCPPIPCCPQPKICCQPTPICLPPQQCCSINFKLPTIPICGRACPSCPCRRRIHKARRLKRHAISSNCHQCSAAGEPWKAVLLHREKRAAPGCSSGFSTMQQNSCGTCGASHLRSTRVKRMGCLPCLGRKKRDTEENSHIRVKRMGCLPCLGRKKRSALSPSGSRCTQCNSLGHLFNRYKRSLFGCSPCAPQPPCGCQGRKKRSVTVKIVKRAPEKCDATCCDYSKCLNRQKKETLVPFM